MPHIPVLLQTVCEYLELKSGDVVIDATAGQGGYSRAIIKAVGPRGKVLMIDWDDQAIGVLEDAFRDEIQSQQCIVHRGNFKDIKEIANSHGISAAQGIVFDFGTSQLTLKEFGKGFSFMKDEPLRMTYASDAEEDAEHLVNTASEKELKRIFSEYGQERFSGRIATAIVRARRQKWIKTSGELAGIISRAVPFRGSRLHPATRVFQALRIHLNHELENITLAMTPAMTLLAPKGRMVAVSYHSLEDRIVKNSFRDFARSGLAAVITPKPVTPGQDEVSANPSSRSAKLRCIQKI